MRWDGSTACMAVDGATDTEVFRAYVQEVLCPTLRTGDVVIMDNLSPHKSTQTIELIQQKVGAQVLFLPPYSPDLNPVEKMWSKESFERISSQQRGSIPAHTHRGHSPGFGAHSRRYELVCLVRLQFYLICSRLDRQSGPSAQRAFRFAAFLLLHKAVLLVVIGYRRKGGVSKARVGEILGLDASPYLDDLLSQGLIYSDIPALKELEEWFETQKEMRAHETLSEAVHGGVLT